MPDYRISVVVDPSTAVPGVNVIESGLNRVSAAAAAVKSAVQRAFDFNTGQATAATSAVDRAIDGVKSSSEQASTAVKSLTGNIGILSASSMKSKETMDDINRSLRAMYPELKKAGAGLEDVTKHSGNARIAQMEMMHVVRGSMDQFAAGANPVQVFTMHLGMIAEAASFAGPALGKVGAFLGSGWGMAVTAAIVILGVFASKLLETSKTLDERIQKLQEDAKETEADNQAQRAFSLTIEGVTEALHKNKDALKALGDEHKSQAELALREALAARIRLDQIQTETRALLEQLRAKRMLSGATVTGGTSGAMMATTGNEEDIINAEERLKALDVRGTEADRQIEQARSFVEVEIGERTGVELIKHRYDDLIDSTRKRLLAEKAVTGEIAAQTKALALRRDAEVAQYEKDHREHKDPSDGVARFKSREQAIGIAGREMQREGLSVTENEQFGGVHAKHKFAQHGKFAIDVNIPGAGVEADNEGDRERLDELARRYQARGYRVLWNGQIYEAGGDGPGRLIPTGRGVSQHRDHLHAEAPASIVGKPTQAGNESAAVAAYRRQAQEEKAAKRLAEQQGDFVQGVVDAAAARGQPNQVEKVDAQVEKVFANYRRRFNAEMSPEAQDKVRTALTEAQSREIAQHFNQAYVEPLDRLKALQGTTGEAREILNKKLEETTRLGRALTPVENQQIENSIHQGDALQREAAILEELRRPQEDYANRVRDLNTLLAKGTIDQTSYNSEVSKLGESARGLLKDMPGRDPNLGRSYSDIAATDTENARHAQELDQFRQQKQQLLALGINYDKLIEAAHKRHIQNLNNIDFARKQMVMSSAMSIADSLTSIAEASAGKQSAVYKAMFAVSKAFAIADAIIKIQQGIANALSLPFPENLAAVATVAAAAASIVSNIQAVALNFADGGYVRGPGSSRSDSVPANLSNGEFVINAKATAENRALLEAINSGKSIRPVANDNVVLAGDSYHVQVGDIHVQGGNGTPDEIGSSVRRAIVGIIRDEIATQKRGGGALTKASGSIMTG